MADKKLTDRSEEMEHDLNRLGEHIDDAEKQLVARRKEADPLADVAGEWEGEQDRGGGDDAVGAKQDADPSATGSQDRERETGADGEEDGGSDERVDEEMANPT